MAERKMSWFQPSKEISPRSKIRRLGRSGSRSSQVPVKTSSASSETTTMILTVITIMTSVSTLMRTTMMRTIQAKLNISRWNRDLMLQTWRRKSRQIREITPTTREQWTTPPSNHPSTSSSCRLTCQPMTTKTSMHQSVDALSNPPPAIRATVKEAATRVTAVVAKWRKTKALRETTCSVASSTKARQMGLKLANITSPSEYGRLNKLAKQLAWL